MTNNFDPISKLLTFNSEDEFYFIQILQRKKDNPNNINGSNNSSRLIKAYYIKSIDELFRLKDEMIFFAKYFNARVGINLNKRSFYKTAFNTMQNIANVMHNKDFKSVKNCYNRACGIHNSTDDKLWIIDIDSKDTSYFSELERLLSKLNPIGPKFKTIIPSKSGCHIITSPFNRAEFNNLFERWHSIPKPDIHSNNPTNLYIP